MEQRKLNQLFDAEQLKGKTIRIAHTSRYDELFISFTDNSFVAYEHDQRTEAFGWEKASIAISQYEYGFTEECLVEIGIISKEEYEVSKRVADELQKEQQIAYEQTVKKVQQARELAELERLKVKYEKNATEEA